MKSRFRLVLSVFFAGLLVAMGLAFQSAETITSIRLNRTMCYGTCPSYEVTLSDDGTVTYHGDAHVKRMGDYLARIKPEAFRKLAQKFVGLGFYSFKGEYEEDVTDMPSQTLTVTSKGGTKKVHNYGQLAPKSLYELHDLVDEVVAEATDWQKVKLAR